MENNSFCYKCTDVVGYAYDCKIICPNCYKLAIKQISDDQDGKDIIAALFEPIFAGTEFQTRVYCEDCNEEIEAITILDEQEN